MQLTIFQNKFSSFLINLNFKELCCFKFFIVQYSQRFSSGIKAGECYCTVIKVDIISWRYIWERFNTSVQSSYDCARTTIPVGWSPGRCTARDSTRSWVTAAGENLWLSLTVVYISFGNVYMKYGRGEITTNTVNTETTQASPSLHLL